MAPKKVTKKVSKKKATTLTPVDLIDHKTRKALLAAVKKAPKSGVLGILKADQAF